MLLQEVMGSEGALGSCVWRGQLVEHVYSLGRIQCSQVSSISCELEEESLQKLSVGRGEAQSFFQVRPLNDRCVQGLESNVYILSRQERERGGYGSLPTDPRKSLTQTAI